MQQASTLSLACCRIERCKRRSRIPSQPRPSILLARTLLVLSKTGSSSSCIKVDCVLSSLMLIGFYSYRAGTPGLVKRYPTMPTVSRISFDFLHYIRPPAQATPAPKDSFEQLVHFLTSWQCNRRTVVSSDDSKVANGGLHKDGSLKDDDGNADNDDGGNEQVRRTTSSDALTVNLLRNLCHVFYFDCNQVCMHVCLVGAVHTRVQLPSLHVVEALQQTPRMGEVHHHHSLARVHPRM